MLSQVPCSLSCLLPCRQPPNTPSRHMQKYLYFIPVSARTVSCSDSPCRCRNFSSCFSSVAWLSFPGQPTAGGQALRPTLCFLPFKSASLGFCRLGLWGGISAQAGLYKCMVHTWSCKGRPLVTRKCWGPQELPPYRREPNAIMLPPVQDGMTQVVLLKRTTGLCSSIFLPAILYITTSTSL